jgi:pilus assembly protein Flp/PilA
LARGASSADSAGAVVYFWARLETDRSDDNHAFGELMLNNLAMLIEDEEGATALEYGLMAAAVAGVLIIVAYFLGARVSNSLNNVAQHVR